jgi:hypothetical protein
VQNPIVQKLTEAPSECMSKTYIPAPLRRHVIWEWWALPTLRKIAADVANKLKSNSCQN